MKLAYDNDDKGAINLDSCSYYDSSRNAVVVNMSKVWSRDSAVTAMSLD